jgi:DNA-binding winged helix-turn-helix (wHTH) protein/tetratricopeptide (TPR) repeat protein
MSSPMHQSVSITTAVGDVVRFGVFEADLAAGELRQRGERVNLQALPFRALRVLLSRPNEVLSREDFRPALWPDGVFVDFDSGLVTAIKRLRDALGESAANPIFIETVGRRGYRWIAPLQWVDASVPKPAMLTAENTNVAPVVGGVHPVSAGWTRRMLPYFLALLVLMATAEMYWRNVRSSKPGDTSGAAGLSTAKLASPAPRGTTNHAAEELYLQGRYYWNKRTPESLNKALDSFTQAIVQDPGYSQAYMGLADCYNLLREFSLMPAREAYPRALAAAKKAVELDDQSSDAHASLAFVSFFGMWDAATADREFQRSIALDPNNGVAHHWYATYLMALRRYPQALTEIERAQALDPTSSSIVSDKGSILFNAGRRDEAVALLKQVEETDPTFVSPHRALAYLYIVDGDDAQYLQESSKVAALLHDKNLLTLTNAAANAFATGGRRPMLQALVEQHKKVFDRGVESPIAIAGTYALLGDKQNALTYLEKGFEQHADGMAEIEGGEIFVNALRGEPRFRELLTKVGLPSVN